MKPKFDVTKPYTTSRENTNPPAVPETPSEKVLEPPIIKKSKEVVSEHVSVKYSKLEVGNNEQASAICRKAYSSVETLKCCHVNKQAPSNFCLLNIERILMPQMASCVLVRYCSTGSGKKPDVFWRPKDRIPDSDEVVIKLRNPATRKEALRKIKYLFLDYGNVEGVKKKNLRPAPPNVHHPEQPRQSAI